MNQITVTINPSRDAFAAAGRLTQIIHARWGWPQWSPERIWLEAHLAHEFKQTKAPRQIRLTKDGPDGMPSVEIVQ